MADFVPSWRGHGLGNEQAIKGVAVVIEAGQVGELEDVGVIDRQPGKAHGLDLHGKHRQVDPEPAQPRLDGELPQRHAADEDLVGGIDQFANLVGDARIAGLPPRREAGIEQLPHRWVPRSFWKTEKRSSHGASRRVVTKVGECADAKSVARLVPLG